MLAHGDRAIAPHDLWSLSAWNPDPLITLALGLIAVTYRIGYRSHGAGRADAFVAGLAVTAVALLSPLERVSGALASAHMVQHVLLTTVAAPLLAASRPLPALLRGAPQPVRTANRRLQTLMSTETRLRMRSLGPPLAWMTAAGVLWFWHAAQPYRFAVHNDWAHGLQHVSFLGSGLLLWSVVLGSARSPRATPDHGVLLLFTMGLQTTLLAALITFSPQPWYDVYAETSGPWGLDPLTDQHLAGVLLWFPSGFVTLAAALWLLVHLIADDRAPGAGAGAGGVGRVRAASSVGTTRLGRTSSSTTDPAPRPEV